MRQLNEVVGRDTTLDIHGFAPNLFGLFLLERVKYLLISQ